ncbi:hypothetical protein GCM10022631_23340 [Deinococcus rubellus]|uniref:hypothetical protein n=1 Tax=Deinococcus rubellus TaxID=1889240 RepID=UPI0031EB615D
MRVGEGRVQMVGHNVFVETGEDRVMESELRFRSQVELAASLLVAGFGVEQVYGNWQRGPVTPKSRIMAFVARRG